MHQNKNHPAQLEALYLHKLVWFGCLPELRSILIEGREKCPTSGRVLKPHPQLEVFYRGVTPLHLAIQLGAVDCISLLIEAGADTLSRTELGFSALQEATSLGNREVIGKLFNERTKRIRQLIENGAETIFGLLNEEIPDFYIEFKWKFHTLIPFILKYCPSDYCRLWKRGTNIRLDTSIYGLQEGKLKPKRSNISYLFECVQKQEQGRTVLVPRLFAVDHNAKIWEEIDSTRPISESELEQLINVQMNMEILANTVEPKYGKEIVVKRAQSGLLFKSDSDKSVHGFECKGFEACDLSVYIRMRTEHLKEGKSNGGVTTKLLNNSKCEKLKAIKNDPTLVLSPSELASPTAGSKGTSVSKEFHESKRGLKNFTPSRSPPPPTSVSMEEFFMQNLEDPMSLPYLHVGRPLKMNVKKKTVSIKFFIAESFPIKLSHIIPILKLVAPESDRMTKLIDFLSVGMPDGFPVKIEIPIYFFLETCVTFKNHQTVEQGIKQYYGLEGRPLQVQLMKKEKQLGFVHVPKDARDWFRIPADYREEVFLKNILSE